MHSSPFTAAVLSTSRTYRVSGGYTLPLAGSPAETLAHAAPPSQLAVFPPDFFGLKLRLLVQEGDTVQVGSPLLRLKDNPEVKIVAPGAGTVSKVEYGPRRAVLSLVIDLATKEEYLDFGAYSLDEIATLSREQAVTRLSEGGAMPFFTRRPVGKMPNPAEMPRCIFVNGMNTAPCAPNPYYMVKDQLAQVKTALDVLAKVCSGTVYLVLDEHTPFEPFELAGVCERPRVLEIHRFSGKHPAGLPGTHIAHLAPLRGSRDSHWTVRLEHLPAIAELFSEGKVLTERRVAVTGPAAASPGYVETRACAPLSAVLGGQAPAGQVRVVDGNALHGNKIENGYIGFGTSQLTLLAEGRKKEFIGWLLPGLDKFTRTRAFLGGVFPRASWSLDTNLHGAARPFVLDDYYDDLVGVDVFPVELMKSILAGDVEEAEKLGLLDLLEEDLALCTFACPSKIEFGSILRRGLDQFEKEG